MRGRSLLLLLCVFMGLSTLAPRVSGQAAPSAPLASSLTGMARAEYEAARLLFKDGDFANARDKFLRAHDLSKDPRLLWNMVVCDKSMRRYTRVLSGVERYLREGGSLLTPEDRKEATDLAEAVKPLVTKLRIFVAQEGADVFFDDEKLGVSPLPAPILVDGGKHRIQVRRKGYKEVDRIEDVRGGGDLIVPVSLQKETHEGRVRIEAGPNDLVSIDGRVVGMGVFEGSFPTGGHTLRVTSKGMTPYQSELVVQEGAVRRVPVTLTPASSTSTWLWIAGGAALAAGAIVGGALLYQAPSNVPQGTIGTFPVAFRGHR